MWPRIKYLKKKIFYQPNHPQKPNSSEGDDTRSSNRSIDADKLVTGKADTTNKRVLNDCVVVSRSTSLSSSGFQSHTDAATSQQGSGKITSIKSDPATGAHQQPSSRPSSNDHCSTSDQGESTDTRTKSRPFVGEVISTAQTRTAKGQAPPTAIQSTTIPEQGGFFGAHNFTMNNPTFNDTLNMIHNDHNAYFISGQPVSMLLKSAGTPEAVLNAAARYPLPRCHMGTRRTIQDRLMSWLLDELRRQRMIWLFGPAGVGKSAIAQTFAENAKDKGLLASTYFFSGTQGEKRSDPLRIIPTLAYQLAIDNPQYKHIIAQKLASDPFVLETTLEAQFRGLILEPFLDIASHGVKPFDGSNSHLVVIDGLDECSDEASQCELVELIREAAQRLEVPLIWLVCSRPEPHITYTFSQLEFASICTRNKLTIDDEARADVERFLRDRFKQIYDRYHYAIEVDPSGSWPTEADFEIIARAADGHFVVAAIAERFIGDRVAKNPQAQLASLVGMLKGLDAIGVCNPLEALDAFYSRILAKVPGYAWALVIQILGLCAHSLDQLDYINPGTELTDTKQLWLFLRTDQAQFYRALETLHSVLDIPTVEDAPNKRLAFYHKSFPDYLTNARRSGKFFVSREQALQYHLACIFDWYNLILQFESPSRVSADEHCRAEFMLRAWLHNNIDRELNGFKNDVVWSVRDRRDINIELWKNDNDFHFDLANDEHSSRLILPMFLVQDGRARSRLVRTEAKSNVVDSKLLYHLSLLTHGKPVQPLDITTPGNPFEAMKAGSVRYVIIGNGPNSGLACIGRGLVNSRGSSWDWVVIWLNPALPPTEEQKSQYQKWTN